MKDNIIKFLASGLGLGYISRAPGTMGSLWGVLLFAVCKNYPYWYLVTLTSCMVILSLPLSHLGEKVFGKKDCPKITIDEVAGQLVTYLFVPFTLTHLILGFILFRFFDIAKIFPADWAQNNLIGGLGVAADDWIAGIQAGVVLYVIGVFV